MSTNENLDYLYEKTCRLERGLISLGLAMCDRCGEYKRDVQLMPFKKQDGFINLCLHCRHDAVLSGEV